MPPVLARGGGEHDAKGKVQEVSSAEEGAGSTEEEFRAKSQWQGGGVSISA